MELESLKIDRKPRTSRRRRGGWPLRIAALAAAAAAVWLFWQPLAGLVDRLRLTEVRTLQVQASHPAALGAVRGTAANGYVIAARRAALSSDVPGRIVEMLVEEGSVVKKGDVVARLFSDELAAALARALADQVAADAAAVRSQAALESAGAERELQAQNLESAQASLEEARAGRTLAQLEYERFQDLVNKGISSPRELESYKADLDRAKARVDSLGALVRAAESSVQNAAHRVDVAAGDLEVARAQAMSAAATVDQSRASLDKMSVRAPFDGIVVLKDAEVGEVVSPNSQGGSNARGSVCTMVDFDSLEVQVDVPETSLSAVRIGAPASVYLDAWPDRGYSGRVDRIWPTANRQKATVEVRVELLEKDERLRPDMGVRVVFDSEATAPQEAAAGDSGPAMLIPEDAVVQLAGESGVFVVERDLVRFQALGLGERRGGRVAVTAGLRAGQRIVLDPPASLQDGDRVRIVER